MSKRRCNREIAREAVRLFFRPFIAEVSTDRFSIIANDDTAQIVSSKNGIKFAIKARSLVSRCRSSHAILNCGNSVKHFLARHCFASFADRFLMYSPRAFMLDESSARSNVPAKL